MTGQLYPRILRAALEIDLAFYPVVSLMGARQVGKTTLGREIAAERGLTYATLDDTDVRLQAIDDPAGFVADLGDRGGVVDEIQRATGLTLAIKSVVDRDDRPGRYILTGSNQPEVSQVVGDSLLGRAAYRTLRPLTLSELRLNHQHRGWSFLFDDDVTATMKELQQRADASGPLSWKEVVCTGGFPRAVAAPSEQRMRLLNDYVTAFVQRDIRSVLGVEDVDRFEVFFRLVAAQTGQELNANGLGADIGVNVKTVRRWLDALARSYMIEVLPAYSRSSGQRAIKAPKIFMVDTALAMAAAREPTPHGCHLENLVICDAAVWRDGAPGRAWYHWRLASGQEVDLVLEENSKLLPVEVKATNNVGWNDTRHLRTFIDRYPNVRRGILLSNDPDIHAMSPTIIAAPWWAVL